MEEKKRGRGRPRLDTKNTEAYASSRRQAVNSMYTDKAVQNKQYPVSKIFIENLLILSVVLRSKCTQKQLCLNNKKFLRKQHFTKFTLFFIMRLFRQNHNHQLNWWFAQAL